MIKRDLNAWDFVEQKPKSNRIMYVGGVGGQILTAPIDHTGYVLWGEPTITDHNIIQIGYNNQGLRVDTNNTVTISDLVVAGSANIPPSEGNLRYNVENNTTEVYINDEWVELGSIHQYPLPRESKWDRFKNWFKNITN